MQYAWLNGEFVVESDAKVPIRDTGLLHGAGLHTTMRAYGGRVFRLDDHLRRLRRSSEALFIPLMHRDEALAGAIGELLRRNELGDARLRLTATRGVSRQDPLHGTRLDPNIFITASAFEPYPEDFYRSGLTVVVVDEQKLNPYDVQAGHKTLDYFSRMAALKSATQRGGGEALWFNVHNYLQSASTANVFIAKDGKLRTPPAPEELRDPAIAAATAYSRSATIPGIARQVVLELARAEGIDATIGSIDINQLLGADEVFLTNSIMGIMPVRRIEQRTVGRDGPGPLTQRLSGLYADEVARELA